MYEKKATISNGHPGDKAAKSITITLVGGSPYYSYIWIDGEVYSVTFGGRNYNIKKTK